MATLEKSVSRKIRPNLGPYDNGEFREQYQREAWVDSEGQIQEKQALIYRSHR